MNLWIAGTTKPKAKARLFCFPFGGGGTQTYRTWPQQFPAEIEVCPVRLPGREGRSNEPCFQEVIPLIQALATGLSPYLDLPFAFFGHSMGTLLAFELTRELRRRGEPLPLCLMISSGKAPHRIIPSPSSKTSPHELPDSALIEKLRYYGGTPKSLFREPELMALILRIMRADIAIVHSYLHVPEAPLDCPILAFGSETDHLISIADMDAWRQHTSASFVLHLFSGGHFYLNQESERTSLVRMIIRQLETLISQCK